MAASSGAVIPAGLVESFKRERAAVFLGAGVSVTAGLPSWQEFVAALAAGLGIEPDQGGTYSARMLLNAPQYFENRYGRRMLIERVRGLMEAPYVRSASHDLIAQLPCSLFYTTNFDELLEESLRRESVKYDLIVSDEAARIYSARSGCQLRKIHGTISQPNTLIITRNDYSHFTLNNMLTLDVLRNDLTQFSFLFLGYGLTDPDFNSIYDYVVQAMGRMRQTHYICVPSMTPLEEQDLRERGIEPIDLSAWPGATPEAKLDQFLTDLVEATSDIVHVRRLFGGLQPRQEVPVVITSRLHELEQYVYFPMCDLHVAQSVSRVLGLIGCTGSITADHHALARYDEYIRQDLVLICSPFGNAFTKRMFEDIDRIVSNITVRWRDTGRDRLIQDIPSGKTFTADNPLEARGYPQTEYALVARFRNPWARDRRIFMLAGLNALGTHAVGDFMSDPRNYDQLSWRDEDCAAILEITYSEHDPYNYRYKIASVHSLTRSADAVPPAEEA